MGWVAGSEFQAGSVEVTPKSHFASQRDSPRIKGVSGSAIHLHVKVNRAVLNRPELSILISPGHLAEPFANHNGSRVEALAIVEVREKCRVSPGFAFLFGKKEPVSGEPHLPYALCRIDVWCKT